MKVKACRHEAHEKKAGLRLNRALESVRALRLRLTGQRRSILAILAQAAKPLSSDEIFARLKKGSGDLVTVYRSLTTMEGAGLLRRYDLGDGTRRYELAEEGHHHHYVHCRGCGSVEAFEGCEFEEGLLRALAKKGYQRIQHSLDVQALCAACRD